MSTHDSALPAPPTTNSTITPVQVLCLLAVVICVAATAWAGISEVDYHKVRIPIAVISLLCAFMSTVAVPDWRGKAGFVAFTVLTGYVAFRGDPTDRPVPLPPEAHSAHAEPARGSDFRSAAAYLHLRALPGDAAAPGPASGDAAAPEPERTGSPDPVSLRLDSVRAIHDGSSGTSDWRFDVYVNRYLRLSLDRVTYQDSPGRQTKRFTRETRFVPAGNPQNALVVQVQGIRSALFGNFVAGGRSDPVRLSELESGRPLPITVLVAADQAEHGQFAFFFTLRKT